MMKNDVKKSIKDVFAGWMVLSLAAGLALSGSVNAIAEENAEPGPAPEPTPAEVVEPVITETADPEPEYSPTAEAENTESSPEPVPTEASEPVIIETEEPVVNTASPEPVYSPTAEAENTEPSPEPTPAEVVEPVIIEEEEPVVNTASPEPVYSPAAEAENTEPSPEPTPAEVVEPVIIETEAPEASPTADEENTDSTPEPVIEETEEPEPSETDDLEDEVKLETRKLEIRLFEDEEKEQEAETEYQLYIEGLFPEDAEAEGVVLERESENKETLLAFSYEILSDYEWEAEEEYVLTIEGDLPEENISYLVIEKDEENEEETETEIEEENLKIEEGKTEITVKEFLPVVIEVEKETVKEAVVYKDSSKQEIRDDIKVTVEGDIPENAEIIAYPVKVELDGEETFAAYKILIMDGENEYHSVSSDGKTITVTIADPVLSIALSINNEARGWHKEGEEVEDMPYEVLEDGSVRFTASEF